MDQQTLADYVAALREAYIQNSMELDRTLLTLSAGGIALLVTLLTAVPVPAWWIAPMYVVPIAAFLWVIRTALVILERNRLHLRQAAIAAKSKTPPPSADPATDRLDKHLHQAFWIGVFGTLILAATTMGYQLAYPPDQQPSPAVQETADVRRLEDGIRPGNAPVPAARDRAVGGPKPSELPQPPHGLRAADRDTGRND